jgi:SsrA-binding protein
MARETHKAPDRAGEGGRQGDRRGDRVVATNRRALHDYHVEERLEAGLVLKGTEVKSLRDGKAQLADSYAVVEGGEAYLYNLHISLYDPGNRFNHDPTRKRKLLLHRKEIRRLFGQVERKGYTLIPLRVYFERGYAKVTIGVARGKREYDKRHAIAERDAARDVRRALRERHRRGD